MTNRRNPRRGVVLLIVLSLLVLFVLVGVTFIVVAENYRRGAKRFSERQLTGDDPSKLLDTAMYQLVRDTRNPKSSLLGHSLLADMWGSYAFRSNNNADNDLRESIRGTVTGYSFQAGGQFLRIDFDVFGNDHGPDLTQRRADYYNGSVLTMLNGDAAGYSTRIVDYAANDDDSGWFVVEAFQNDTPLLVIPAVGDVLWVNGRPFNGVGVGYNRATKKVDQNSASVTANVHIALLPHLGAYMNLDEPDYRPYDLDDTAIPPTSVMNQRANEGGEDESWDAVDNHNMFLAMVPPDPAVDPTIIPSFHRPSLINYWQTKAPAVWAGTKFRQRVIMRPMPWPAPWGHPNFTGSNPSFNPITGPWDVDNDGDGRPDSIWLDLGFPVKAAEDGRLYRPLFAILCVDLDGRINVNAHGSTADQDVAYWDTTAVPTGGVAAGNFGSVPLKRGEGYGPAGIKMMNIIDTASGDHGELLTYRYGNDVQAGIAGDDLLSAVKSLGVPNDYANQLSAYASPPDLFGRGAIFLDHNGQPVPAYMGQTNEATDDPFEANLVHANSGGDTHYGLGDLERLLRHGDIDTASLPTRLSKLTATFSTTPANRRKVTTHSFHVPVPSGLATPELLNVATNPIHPTSSVVDLMVRRLADGGVTAALIPGQLDLMLPFEIRHGQPMDVNRLWGNGLDDNNNGTVDEPNVTTPNSPRETAAELLWTTTAPNYMNNNPSTASATMPRQIFARHLYCLMMMVTDKVASGAVNTFPVAEIIAMPSEQTLLTPDERREVICRRVAQWAINVVDFRDSDAIMTPFEYDVRPWNGWNVDGDPRTDDGNERRVVWGCEYPDLLITETLAFHDRRVKDTKHDNAAEAALADEDDAPQKRIHENHATDAMKKGDQDLDQYRIPQGSLIAELYCPRNRYANNPMAPRELYTVDTVSQTVSLDLRRLAPTRADGVRYPVWQLAISESHLASNAANPVSPAVRADNASANTEYKPDTTSFEPLAMNVLPGTTDQLQIERLVWFTGNLDINSDSIYEAIHTGTDDRHKLFFNNDMPGLVPAGKYAVIGPRDVTNIGSKQTSADPPYAYDPANQRIEIAANAITYYDNANTAASRTAVGMIARSALTPDWEDEQPEIGLNVSEPMPKESDGSSIYYPKTDFQVDATAPFDAYDSGVTPAGNFLDTPLDNDDDPTVQNRPLRKDSMNATGTYLDYKTVFLQRLANPLLPWNPMPGTVFDFNNADLHESANPVNPYITVDWQTIDLTVFNGEDKATGWMDALMVAGNPIGDFDPDDPDLDDDPPATDNAPLQKFESRQRGDVDLVLDSLDYNLLWSFQSEEPHQTNEAATANPAPYFDYSLVETNGFLNETFGTAQSAPVGYEGSPPNPFPWLTWNNRPFASHLELMLVPASSPARLSFEFGRQSASNQYGTVAGPSPPDPPDAELRAPYRHLLNFFHSSRYNTASQTSTLDDAANWYRVLDLLEVPSRFVGTERWYNPAVFVSDANAATFRPPFNRLSRFRDPGRVNINTIFDEQIWNSINGGNVAWSKVRESRQGYTGTSLNSDFPTRFANPFRSAGSADLMPAILAPAVLGQAGVQATLLRSELANPATPLFDFYSEEVYNDTRRNPYFKYNSLQRLGNLVTTRSNVYAVWITMGFFEVDPVSELLGMELGYDTGEVKRHRSFYAIDRTIPVAFEPGQNHNVDRAVVLRRFIE